MQRDLTRGSVSAQILAFSLPLALGMASHAAFNLIDLWIVGSLGGDAVAAVHLGSTINFFPMIFGNGISVGTVALLAGLVGEGRRRRGRRLANLSLAWMLATALVLGIACWVWAGPLIAFQEAHGASSVLGQDYLEVVSLGTFTMFLLMHTTGVLRAMGNASFTVVLLVGSNALNIGLDYALIFGWDAFGIPAFGVAGAAWATVIARLVGGLAGLWLLARRDSPLRPGLRLPLDAVRATLAITRLGVPQAVQMFVRASLVLTVTRIAGQHGGTPAQTALGVATRLDTFVLFGAVGWAGGATAMVAQCAGKDLEARCHKAAWLTAGMAAGLALCVGLAFLVFSRVLFGVFVHDVSAEVVRHGQLYFGWLAFSYPPATASLVLAGSLNGAGSSIRPMLFDVAVISVLLQPVLWLWEGGGAAGGLATCWILVLAANWILLGAYALWMRQPRWAGGPCHT